MLLLPVSRGQLAEAIHYLKFSSLKRDQGMRSAVGRGFHPRNSMPSFFHHIQPVRAITDIQPDRCESVSC